MLNRAICEKCRNKTWPGGHEVQGKCAWICAEKHFGRSHDYIAITAVPPIGCEYKLEHAVAEAMKDA